MNKYRLNMFHFLKLINKHYIRIVVLILLFVSEEILASKYSDVFTTDIYNQDDILGGLKPKIASNSITEEEINQELEETFLRAKEEELEKHCLRRIKQKIEVLSKEYEELTKGNFLSEIFDTLAKGIAAIGLSTGNASLPIISTILNFFSVATKPHDHSILQEIRNLKFEIEDLQDGLAKEPILDLEKKYVKQKRKIEDEDLKRKIEKNLLALRKADYYFAQNIEKQVGYSLNLPLQIGERYDLFSNPNNMEKLTNTIDNDRIIRNFEPVIQDQLKVIITDIAGIPSRPSPNKRRTLVFSGDPSCGKTSAARAVPKILGLPYYEVTFQSPSEVSKTSLEGTDPVWPDAKPGWLAEALMKKGPNGHSVKNAVLILNDLDRVMYNGADVNQEVNSFLLSYLDPSRKSYHSPYFDADLPLESLIVIITANKNFDVDELGAFRTRTTQVVQFPNLKYEIVKKMADEELELLSRPDSVLKCFSFSYVDASTIDVIFNNEGLLLSPGVPSGLFSYLRKKLAGKKSVTPASPNDLIFSLSTDIEEGQRSKATIRQLLNGVLSHAITKFQIKLRDAARKRFAKAEKKRNKGRGNYEHLYRQAAIYGNGQACYKLCSPTDNIYEPTQLLTHLFWLRRGSDLGHAGCISRLQDQSLKVTTLWTSAARREVQMSSHGQHELDAFDSNQQNGELQYYIDLVEVSKD